MPCEVYWNGALGWRLWLAAPASLMAGFKCARRIHTCPATVDGVIAIRVWTGPLGSSSAGEVGGLARAPLIGDSHSIYRLDRHMELWLPGGNTL